MGQKYSKINRSYWERLERGEISKSEVIIVGDSLTSDICGGNNAGIRTCWYNPSKAPAQGNYRIDYEITDLHEIYDIIK